MAKDDVLKTMQEIRKAEALLSLAKFRKMYLKNKSNHFEDSVAHEEIMKSFDELKENPGQKIAVAAPRGFGKTELISAYIIYALCLKRYKFVVILSHTSKQAKDLLRNMTTMMASSSLLVQDFPEVAGSLMMRKEKYSDTVNYELEITSFGLKQSFRGLRSGSARPDLLVVDDIDNDNYTHNKRVKDNIKEIFQGKVLKIGDENTNIIFLGNIFSKNTLIYDVFNDSAFGMFKRLPPYKAMINEPSRIDFWERYSKILYSQETYKNQTGKAAASEFYQEHKAEMDKGFRSLWPKRWGPCELIPQFLIEPNRFRREMQNEPESGENCFKPDKFQFWDKNFPSKESLLSSFDKNYKVGLAIDPSMGGPEGDFAALVVVAKNKNVYYVLQTMLLKESSDKLLKYIFEIVKQGVRLVIVEVDGGQGYFATQIENESIKQGIPIKLEKVNQQKYGSKEQRIRGLDVFIHTGTIRFNSDDKVFLQQMYDYPCGGHDDGPDALETCIRVLTGMKSGSGVDDVLNVFERMNGNPDEKKPSLGEQLLQGQGSYPVIDSINQAYRRYHGNIGFVPKIMFVSADPNGAAILESLINKGVLEEALPWGVRLKSNYGVAIVRPPEMQGNNFDDIWNILFELHK